ncbi:inositol monophosphatase family protein [Fictibacillus phosphorivorans]|uniref:inositol monophosphatase family protein n=1 Tax=Fictibacillus phosphorivorans TaxID=1221500 RepID=UPI00203C6B63|nr:inositol monophosphatase family protein [Fictibacillus phosphorivorans]MCM3717310.1 inositol monophosphatase family protein [Fictibacillus phosphorivorans]MCM3774998.1 inositol monophosphatase family protein [Fictibacillus phosphorivorans]
MEKETCIKIEEAAKAWTAEAAEMLQKSFEDTLTITYKSHIADLVTNMDKNIEKFFIEKIQKVFPDHKVLGEEGYGDEIQDTSGIIWIIDPIDGTTNFIHQQSNFAISIGIYEDGKGIMGLIYDVGNQNLYFAKDGKGAFLNDYKLPKLDKTTLSEAVIGVNATWVGPNKRINHENVQEIVRKSRGTRSYGSAAIELAYVASGKLDAYMTMRLSPWDFAAGLILLNEVGGIATNTDGKPIQLLKQNSILAARPGLHEEILNVLVR